MSQDLLAASWRHRKASAAIPARVSRLEEQGGRWCEGWSKGRRRQVSPLSGQAGHKRGEGLLDPASCSTQALGRFQGACLH